MRTAKYIHGMHALAAIGIVQRLAQLRRQQDTSTICEVGIDAALLLTIKPSATVFQGKFNPRTARLIIDILSNPMCIIERVEFLFAHLVVTNEAIGIVFDVRFQRQ